MMTNLEHEPTLRCPECASERVVWRIERKPGSFSRRSDKALCWTCKDCGAEWREQPASNPADSTHAAAGELPEGGRSRSAPSPYGH